MRRFTLALLVILAWGLFTIDLEERPMHTDEAVHGYRLGLFMESGVIAYDPLHFHGPVLYQVSHLLARISGQHELAELEAATLRRFAGFGGLLLLLALWCLGNAGGGRAGGWAALLVVISPGLLYYSRYFIAEIWFVAFTWWGIWAVWRWVETRRWTFAVLAGVLLGLLQATKETILVVGLAGVLALGLTLTGLWWKADPDLRRTWTGRLLPPLPAHLGLALGAWLVTAFVLFSDFFQHPAGFVDAFRSYFMYELVPGHEKPWHYYLELFAGKGGMEHGLVVLAAIGLVFMARDFLRGKPDPLGWFIRSFTGLQFILYSAVGYKTPWLIIGVLPGLCWMGGHGLARLWQRTEGRGGWAAVGGLLAGVAGAWSLTTALRASFVDPTGQAGANAYAYVHTLPDVPALAAEVERLADERYGLGRQLPIQGYGFETWPFPWYFRAYPRAVFTDARPEALTAPVVIQVPDPATGLEIEIFSLDYSIDVGQIREGVPYVVFLERR